MNQHPSTLQKIYQGCCCLKEGDRVRVLKFVQFVIECRVQKKTSRTSRYQHENGAKIEEKRGISPPIIPK